ncbi:hypothetical protein CELD12_11810 [Cellulomonas sp. NTE-D12]|nr:hypothetical protein CELD12_11810 [Cellulomonas sp. NTE-D12]
MAGAATTLSGVPDSVVGVTEDVDPAARRAHLHAVAMGLEWAELTHPFDATTAVYKVAGRMFALVGASAPYRLNVKVDPEDGAALRREFPTLLPGWHMDHRHWLTARLDDDQVPDQLLEELLVDSYRTVHANLSRRTRGLLAAGLWRPEPATVRRPREPRQPGGTTRR